jgi:glycosyltransferase involved in cell wall biosynthesis
MKVLLVTEKCNPIQNQRDGGARLVETFKKAFGNSLSIMQFGPFMDNSATWSFEYPFDTPNRFEKRLMNADFIIEQVKIVEQNFTHIIFVHISMQFGLVKSSLQSDIEIWTFPMFLTPSYIASGEQIPEHYFEMERLTLANSNNIITPSHLERHQLMEVYSIPEENIYVVPRGVDVEFFKPKVRLIEDYVKFCSIGSIKPQKNILGLIDLFHKIKKRFPNVGLKIIGPIQNIEYHARVLTLIQSLALEESVEFTGYVAPEDLSNCLEDCHIHLSTSMYETFGRSIFETLAAGLPNIAHSTGNAAAEFLKELPYAYFEDDSNKMVDKIAEMLLNLPVLSYMAFEIGKLYDDKFLSSLLIAKICRKTYIAISDFDGTLFHKDNSQRTQRCIENFKKFPFKVLCSARQIEDLLEQLTFYDLKVDWIISYSGALVTDGSGKILWNTPLDLSHIEHLEKSYTQNTRFIYQGTTLQIAIPAKLINEPSLGLRYEIYQDTAYFTHWEASKFRAAYKLLFHINWFGQVCAFGDGPYDQELLTYFDGVLITSTKSNNRHKEEIEYVKHIL